MTYKDEPRGPRLAIDITHIPRMYTRWSRNTHSAHPYISENEPAIYTHSTHLLEALAAHAHANTLPLKCAINNVLAKRNGTTRAVVAVPTRNESFTHQHKTRRQHERKNNNNNHAINDDIIISRARSVCVSIGLEERRAADVNARLWWLDGRGTQMNQQSARAHQAGMWNYLRNIRLYLYIFACAMACQLRAMGYVYIFIALREIGVKSCVRMFIDSGNKIRAISGVTRAVRGRLLFAACRFCVGVVRMCVCVCVGCVGTRN